MDGVWMPPVTATGDNDAFCHVGSYPFRFVLPAVAFAAGILLFLFLHNGQNGTG